MLERDDRQLLAAFRAQEHRDRHAFFALDGDGGRFLDIRMLVETRFDLPEFDAIAVPFDHAIAPTHVDVVAFIVGGDHIAGAVPTLALGVGVLMRRRMRAA